MALSVYVHASDIDLWTISLFGLFATQFVSLVLIFKYKYEVKSYIKYTKLNIKKINKLNLKILS